MPPVAFPRRLCGIIPPRAGIWSRTAESSVRPPSSARSCALVPACDDNNAPPCSPATAAPHVRAGRLPWAELLRRVFADDVLQCACGGRRSVIAVVTDPSVARTLLVALDLPLEPSAFASARDPPQAELAWDDPASFRTELGPRQAPVRPRPEQTSSPLHLATVLACDPARRHGRRGSRRRRETAFVCPRRDADATPMPPPPPRRRRRRELKSRQGCARSHRSPRRTESRHRRSPVGPAASWRGPTSRYRSAV